MVLSSFFVFGPLNNYDKANSEVNNYFKSVHGANKDTLVSHKSNTKSKLKKGNVISVKGKCSCSLLSDYKIHRNKWVNYCPQCHKYVTLRFTTGGGCPEGMLYCTSCDADFCAVHGKEHVYRGSTYLRQA